MSAFGGGDITGSEGSFAEGGAVRGGMPITVGERGRELFIPSTNGTIVPNQDLGGGTNITFNIQANDVRGIRELLIDNRATIINLVNQGANAKGKSNIV
jgi:phage-related minor tail protein